ncbi:hypothetical protein QT653_22520, partial [Xanthomonas citri pv. citri]
MKKAYQFDTLFFKFFCVNFIAVSCFFFLYRGVSDDPHGALLAVFSQSVLGGVWQCRKAQY